MPPEPAAPTHPLDDWEPPPRLVTALAALLVKAAAEGDPPGATDTPDPEAP